MTDKEFKVVLEDILYILDESENTEQAIKKIKDKYLKDDK